MERHITITEWNERYAQAFIDLSLEWLEKYALVEPEDLRIIEHPHEAVLDAGGAIFFALDGDRPVGTAAMIPEGDGVFELAKFAVTEAYRRNGIGCRLLEKALAFARERQAEKIVLCSNRRLSGALALYRAHGFTEVPAEHMKFATADVAMELIL